MVPSLCIGLGRNQRGLDRWLYEHEHGNVTSCSQVGGKHHKLFSDLCTNINLNCIWALKVLSHINGKMKIQWFLGILDLLLVVLNLNLNHTSVIFNQMYRVSAYVHRYVRVWHHNSHLYAELLFTMSQTTSVTLLIICLPQSTRKTEPTAMLSLL